MGMAMTEQRLQDRILDTVARKAEVARLDAVIAEQQAAIQNAGKLLGQVSLLLVTLPTYSLTH